jgi:hypothetical protein
MGKRRERDKGTKGLEECNNRGKGNVSIRRRWRKEGERNVDRMKK